MEIERKKLSQRNKRCKLDVSRSVGYGPGGSNGRGERVETSGRRTWRNVCIQEAGNGESSGLPVLAKSRSEPGGEEWLQGVHLPSGRRTRRNVCIREAGYEKSSGLPELTESGNEPGGEEWPQGAHLPDLPIDYGKRGSLTPCESYQAGYGEEKTSQGERRWYGNRVEGGHLISDCRAERLEAPQGRSRLRVAAVEDCRVEGLETPQGRSRLGVAAVTDCRVEGLEALQICVDNSRNRNLETLGDISLTKDYQERQQDKGDRGLESKGREGHFPSACPYWAGQGGEKEYYCLNTNRNLGQNEAKEQIRSPMDRGEMKEMVGAGVPIDRSGIGNQGVDMEDGFSMGRCHQIEEGSEGTENTRDQGMSHSQRNSGGSSSGLKMKRLARAGMVRGDASPNGHSNGKDLADNITRSYAEMLKGEREGEDKEGNPDNASEMGVENQLNTSLEGEVVRCEFEEDHYEGVVNCFRDSTILVHFLGRPPNEVELRRWLQEIWSGKGWYIDRVRYLGKGYYAVVFDENVRIRDVLKEGPWYFRGGLVLVQPWEPEFSVDHGSYGRHPAWVELCNLPVHLWQFARSFFETIGTVISFDERQTFTFRPHARACVLVDTNKELPKKLEIKTGGRVMYEIKILILGLPNACFRCKQSGHFIRNCPYKLSGERKSGGSNETVKTRGETSNGKGKEVVVEMEGIEEEEPMRENQMVEANKGK